MLNRNSYLLTFFVFQDTVRASAKCLALTVTAIRIFCSGKGSIRRLDPIWWAVPAQNYTDCVSVFSLWPFWRLFNDTELIPCWVWISLNEWMFCGALTFNLCLHLLWPIGCQICWYHWFLCHTHARYVNSWSLRLPSQKISFSTFLFCSKFADCAGMIISKGKVKRMHCFCCVSW